jgi:hypothetical protein
MVDATPRPFSPQKRDPVPPVQQAVWTIGLGLTGAENLAPPGIDPRTVRLLASRRTECVIAYMLDRVLIEIMKIGTLIWRGRSDTPRPFVQVETSAVGEGRA